MESFIKIGPSVWAVEMTHTDTQTDTHTHRHTHTPGSIVTYSVKLTEYKNEPESRLPCGGDEIDSKKY